MCIRISNHTADLLDADVGVAQKLARRIKTQLNDKRNRGIACGLLKKRDVTRITKSLHFCKRRNGDLFVVICVNVANGILQFALVIRYVICVCNREKNGFKRMSKQLRLQSGVGIEEIEHSVKPGQDPLSRFGIAE